MRRLLSYVLLAAVVQSASAAEPKLIEVRKIWDQAPHNAFTDLVRFKDRWFCVFREGQQHVAPDGALRVITSTDGKQWESAALITSSNSDLRDAKINITPSGELMLCGAEALHDKSKHTHQSLSWFSKDGRNWSQRHEIGDPNFWLWRVTWHQGKAFGVGYDCGKTDRSARLYVSDDGKKFDTHVARLYDKSYPNETSLVFDGDTCYCLLRRDEKPDNHGLLGVSQPPYTKWEWKDLGARIGGPHMLRLPDGRYVAAVRLYDAPVRTSLVWIEPATGKMTEFLKLPSGGDTSYAGLVWHDNLLWVSYYSSHENKKTSIYLAQVDIPLQTNTEGKQAAKSMDEIREIGNRRELFVDKYLINRLNGTELKLHPPQLAPAMQPPIERFEYGTIIKDGELFRLYSRDARGVGADGNDREVTRYCESRDGIHWTAPKLGLVELDGSKENNVILHEAPFCHNFSPFLDTRPGVPADQRFKALAGTAKSMLVAFVSSDGIHWRKLRKEPVITYTKEYALDSQNVSFWSEAEQQYVCYFRHFLNKKVRSICRTTSQDYVNWTEAVPMEPNFPDEHLYTSQTHPYFRAPQIYIALPTRYQPTRGSSTDILFMTARGDQRYDRTFREAYIWPGLDPARWGNRANYAVLNVLPTGENEMSIYTTPFRRWTLRTDGFASVHAGADEGELITRPLRFQGKQLLINYATSAGGNLRVELQDAAGKPLPGFTLADCPALVGDTIEQPVKWTTGGDVSSFSGQTVRLRFVMQEADLYALRFGE